ncbi:MAG: hypothetical protein FVQ79_13945 [Planctomycetes bacterium]|nr:hypothetical protein [Planctomycetota bacterium]
MIEDREKWNKERLELMSRVRSDLRGVIARGIAGYDGWVGLTETTEQAYNDRVKSSEWVLKMLMDAGKL